MMPKKYHEFLIGRWFMRKSGKKDACLKSKKRQLDGASSPLCHVSISFYLFIKSEYNLNMFNKIALFSIGIRVLPVCFL